MTFIHETGHISAAMKHNAKTGGIGIGMYFYFLVAWADIHESWNLKSRQSMLISIGGIYFNAICIIPFIILGIVIKSRAIADFVIMGHFMILFMFNPFLKMDGYWFISEWIGVPNLQTKISMFLWEYLPSIFKKERKRNIFSSYPSKVRTFCILYAILTGVFLIYFMFFIIQFGITMLLNFDRDYVANIYNLIYIEGSRHMYFNSLIRNTFLLIACTRILWTYLKKIIIL
jgi:putative peptide zinc metalloprotease protein